jgi:hypothetical protein
VFKFRGSFLATGMLSQLIILRIVIPKKAVPAAESIQGSAGSGTFTLLLFASASSYTGVGSLDLKV